MSDRIQILGADSLVKKDWKKQTFDTTSEEFDEVDYFALTKKNNRDRNISFGPPFAQKRSLWPTEENGDPGTAMTGAVAE